MWTTWVEDTTERKIKWRLHCVSSLFSDDLRCTTVPRKHRDGRSYAVGKDFCFRQVEAGAAPHRTLPPITAFSAAISDTLADEMASGVNANVARPDFDAIYLDTNVLIASNWPDPSIYLNNLIVCASWLRVSTFVPEAVEQEAEQHWIRNVRRATTKMTNAVEEFERITRAVHGEVHIESQDLNDLVRRYREHSDAAKQQLEVGSVPFTTRPLRYIFELAVRYTGPFVIDQEGKGFQDASIISSVIEHVCDRGYLHGIFVTDDQIHRKGAMHDLAPDFDADRLRFLTRDEAWKLVYSQFFDQHVKTPWERERAQAVAVAKASLEQLKAFIQSKLSPSMLSGHTWAKPLAVLAVENIEVQYAQTPVPPAGGPDRTVKLAIAVLANCRALVERTNALWWAAQGGSPEPPTQEEVPLVWIGGVEATADIHGGGIANLQFVSLIPSEQLSLGKYWERE